MPHRHTFRDAFEPHDLQIATQAFDRAFAVLVESGDAGGDPEAKINLAQQIIAILRASPELTFLEITNRAIAAYRHHRAMTMVRQAQIKRAL